MTRKYAPRLRNVPFQSRVVPHGRERAAAFEPLEERRLFAVSLDAQGWTNVTPSSDSRIVYVSSSQGSDSNNGLSPDSPVKTVSKGRSLLRNNSPDWMLLKRGDVWFERFGSLNLSGRSAQEPLLISAYGTGDRPLLNTRSDNAITTNVTPANHVAIVGIRFNSNTNDPTSPDFTNTAAGYGFYGVAPVNDILIEDCYFSHYSTNLLFQSTQGLEQNISVRRNVLVDSTGGRSQGVYVNGVENITFEENLFDHNGWSTVTDEDASIYNHNLYMSAHNAGVVIRGNIFANASSHGLQARAGGIVENNLFIKNPIGMVFGNGTSFTPGGVVGRVSDNVFVGSRDLDGQPRGYAMEVGNTKPGGGTVVEGNIFAHDDQRNFPAIKLSMGNPPTNLSEAVGLNDLTITDNIVYDWYQGLSTDANYVPGASGFKALNGLVIRDNDFQQTISTRLLLHGNPYDDTQEVFDDNHYWDDSPSSGWFSVQTATKSFDDWQGSLEPNANRTQRKYRDPDRDIETYNRSLGGAATTDAFLASARQQSRQNWRPQLTADAVNDYVRDGFTVDSAVPTAGLEAPDVNALGGTTHAFIVHYADDNGIDPRTLGTGDVRVTGPNGYDVPATLVSVDRAGTTTRAAIYMIAAPTGGWSESTAGLYTVTAQSNQVADLRGNYLKSGVIGTFWVRGDTEAPTAAALAAPVTVAGGTSQYITVTYQDNHAVDSSSITDGDLLITGPNGFEQLASLVSIDSPGDGSPRVATYRFDAPDGAWDATDNGLYTVALRPDEISDTSGNYNPGGTLTTFVTNISGAPAPLTRLSAASVTSAGAPIYTFTVAYDGNGGATAESAGESAVLVTGPAGFTQLANVESVSTTSGGQVRVVKYSIATPQGSWDAADNGRYALSLLPPAFAQGVPGAPPTAGTTIGSFTVSIARADYTPPSVVSAAFSATYDDKIILQFSEDVSASLTAADFELRQIVGRTSFAPARLRLTYDRRGNRAILRFDGTNTTGELTRGLYQLTIRSAGVNDGAGNKLDGDNNGTAGGNYTLTFRKA